MGHSATERAIMVAMIDYSVLLVALLRATIRARGDLVAENLLLRQQLDVLTRPTRKQGAAAEPVRQRPIGSNEEQLTEHVLVGALNWKRSVGAVLPLEQRVPGSNPRGLTGSDS